MEEVEEAPGSVKPLDDNVNVDVDEEISGDKPLAVIGSPVVDLDTEVELGTSVTGFTVNVSPEEVEDPVKTSNVEDTVDRSELLDNVEGIPTSEEVDEVEVAEGSNGSRESVEVDVVEDGPDVAEVDGGSAKTMVPRTVPLPGYVAMGIGSVMIEVPEYATLATA